MVPSDNCSVIANPPPKANATTADCTTPIMSPSASVSPPSTASCPLTVKTSKAWVLPPRPKPGRKPTQSTCAVKEKKKRGKDLDKSGRQPASTTSSVISPSAPQLHTVPMQQQHSINHPSTLVNMSSTALNKNISVVEAENKILKDHLLTLIHDYKHLRNTVLLQTAFPVEDHISSTSRKRSFHELNTHDPMSELIDNMSDLSHNTPLSLYSIHGDDDLKSPEEIDEEEENLFNFIKLDDEDPIPVDAPDDMQFLSRTTSPSETDCENSLMSSLTRSTTVSTNNSSFMLNDYKPKHAGFAMLKETPYNFYNLPNFASLHSEGEDVGFTFDKLSPHEKFSSILKQDQYNMIADFLEEKLIDNDRNYYVNHTGI